MANKESNENKTSYFYKDATDSGFTNFPSAVAGRIWMGVREVYWYNSTHILVKITEMHPTPGRTWFTFFNVNTWTGWFSSTPVSGS